MPKILYLVTEDWYFCSHRLALAREARRRGFDVIVATRVREHRARITDEGLRLIPISMRRRSGNPRREFDSIRELVRVYRSERPDIVHHVSLKPVLYGALPALAAGVPGVVNALTGMGHLFTSNGWKARLLGPLVKCALGICLRRPNSWVILQNPDDRSMLLEAGMADPGRMALIRGSGVDVEAFRPSPEPPDPPTVLLASRMLWDKGVGEFVEAARRLRDEGIGARFVLAGDTDPDNPSAVPRERLAAWREAGAVEWWGHRPDMPSVLSQAHVVCLPSYYREGLPKVLIEAAACARPIVTTDTPGCREIVRDGENGLLVPPRNEAALAGALRRLVKDPALRRRLGARGRRIAVEEFAVERVVEETMAIYERLLERCASW